MWILANLALDIIWACFGFLSFPIPKKFWWSFLKLWDCRCLNQSDDFLSSQILELPNFLCTRHKMNVSDDHLNKDLLRTLMTVRSSMTSGHKSLNLTNEWKRAGKQSIQVILAKPMAEVSKKTKKPIGSGCATLIWTSFHLTFLSKSLLSLYFSIEISTFSLLFYWNLFTFLLKSLLSLYFSIETSTFSLRFYWNHYFLFTFLLQSLLSRYFSIGTSTFSLLFFWNLYFLCTFLLKSLLSFLLFSWNRYFLFTCLLKSLLSLYFSIEISTFSLLFSTTWLTYSIASPPALHCEMQSCLASPNVTTHHMCACSTSASALYCEKPSCLASPNITTHTKISKKSYSMPRIRRGARQTRAATAPHTPSHITHH